MNVLINQDQPPGRVWDTGRLHNRIPAATDQQRELGLLSDAEKPPISRGALTETKVVVNINEKPSSVVHSRRRIMSLTTDWFPVFSPLSSCEKRKPVTVSPSSGAGSVYLVCSSRKIHVKTLGTTCAVAAGRFA